MSDSRNVSWKHFVLALLIEVVTVVIVILIFRNLHDRLWAARFASLTFVLSGASLIVYLWPLKRKMWSVTWLMAIIFILMFALPMGLFRWLSTEPFAALSWLGLDGPDLHAYSTKYYYGMLAAPFFDMMTLWRNSKKRIKFQKV